MVLSVDLRRQVTGMDIHMLDLPEKSCVPDHADGSAHQILVLLHNPSDVIGESASCITQILAFFENGHFRFGVYSHEAGGGFASAGDSPYNQDLFAHFLHLP
ncbi:MAG: hypothetical protein XE12_1584 [Synergistales bacterium 54_9]|nr:MAG: hypothetical protein XE12_1584 [Synergistales bacterium 54_9]